MKYPIGIQRFDQIIEDGYVYVDKTAFVYSLVKEGAVYFMSRPPRFGKSLLISTLKNYFLGRKELFKGLAIDHLETEWKSYPVFHIDFNRGDFTHAGALENLLDVYISGWEKDYGLTTDKDLLIGHRFIQLLKRAHEQCGNRAVVLIDEYDKPILDLFNSKIETTLNGNLIPLKVLNYNVLNAFYSIFKAADEHLHFVFLTGVTKCEFSGFNQSKDISIDSHYEALCGFTEVELEKYFTESINTMAVRNHCDVCRMKQLLKQQYNGYNFGPNLIGIYNPFSLMNAFDSLMVKDYWYLSSIPPYLLHLLNHTKVSLKELTGRYYEPAEFSDYEEDVDKPLSMIYQSGYLTIKNYNRKLNAFLLDFPNKEIINGYLKLNLKTSVDAGLE